MEDDNNPINKALNLGPIETNDYSKAVSTIVNNARNDSAEEDFKFARANIREVVENGKGAIEELSSVAQQTQEPRAYEVLAKLMDSVIEANKQLLEMQEKIRKIDRADMPVDAEARKSVTNNLFLGTTAELQKMIEGINKNNE
jgi:hypothetical protein